MSHKIVLSEDCAFYLSDEEYAALIEKGYITDEA
nr:MAG TPA: repressor [Caudoviricetes sp.]